ncbi:MAG: DUF2924 domain-containing protein [Parvularculaceae bacterium]
MKICAPAQSGTGDEGEALSGEIARIERLPLPEAKAHWWRLKGSEPPPTLPPTILRGALAHAIQARRFGGLSNDARRTLERLAKKLRENPRAALLKGETPPAGARLIRDWRGERHEVEIIDSGFVYRGKIYKSLSVIAEEITGAHWSGPRFFGLKNRRKEDVE